MLKSHFKPIRNGVLIKASYKVKGMVLISNAKNPTLKVLDKQVVAIGPDVNPETEVKVGDFVVLKAEAFGVEIMHFSDNEASLGKLSDRIIQENTEYVRRGSLLPRSEQAAHNANSPATKEYDAVGYILVPVSEIVGTCNSVEIEEAPVLENKADLINLNAPSIILPVR